MPNRRFSSVSNGSLIARFMGPTWGPPGSYRPQLGPMLAPWSLLSGLRLEWNEISLSVSTYAVPKMILIVSIRQLVTIFCEVKAIYSTPSGVVIFISKAATETRQCIINCYTTRFNQGYWRVTFTSNGLSKLIVQLGSNFSVKYLCRLQWFACPSADKYKA